MGEVLVILLSCNDNLLTVYFIVDKTQKYSLISIGFNTICIKSSWDQRIFLNYLLCQNAYFWWLLGFKNLINSFDKDNNMKKK